MANDISSATVRAAALPLVAAAFAKLTALESAITAGMGTTAPVPQEWIDANDAANELHSALKDCVDELKVQVGDPDGEIADESGGTNKG